MLGVIVLLVTCLIAGSTATKSSGHVNHYNYKIVSPQRISLAPRQAIRNYVSSRPIQATIPIRRPAQRTRVVRRQFYSPTQIFNSGYSQDDDSFERFDDNSFSSFGAVQGIGQTIPIQGNAFTIPNYSPIQGNAFTIPNFSPMHTFQSFSSFGGDDSGFEYSGNTIPLV